MYEIRIKIHDEADLYEPFDPDGSLLSEDVVSYFSRRFQERAVGEAASLRIISDVPVNEERVRANIRSYAMGALEQNAREQRKYSLKQLYLVLIGLAFIALWLVLKRTTEGIGSEVLSIIGSFAVWEAANIWIVEKPALRLSKHRLKGLADMEVLFSIDAAQDGEQG